MRATSAVVRVCADDSASSAPPVQRFDAGDRKPHHTGLGRPAPGVEKPPQHWLIASASRVAPRVARRFVSASVRFATGSPRQRIGRAARRFDTLAGIC